MSVYEVIGFLGFSNIQIFRDDGLRRGFDALDVEHEGEIPVEKFKERIRKVQRSKILINSYNYNIDVSYAKFSL